MDQLVKDYIDSQVTWNALTRYVAGRNLRKLCKHFTQANLDGKAVYVYLKKQGYGLYTIKQYMIVLAQFEEKALKSSRIQSFLTENSHAFRNAYQTKTKLLTEEIYQEMLAKAPTKFMYNALILMGRAGLRKSEASKATWACFETDTKFVIKGKGGKVRVIPFVKKNLKAHGFAEICGDVNDMTTYRFISKFGFSPHDLRAFFATNTANIPGLNLNDVASVLGHSSVATTQRYVRVDYDRVSKALIGE